MITYACQVCGARKRTALTPPPASMPCGAATGTAGGRCGGRMVQPFTLTCTRCGIPVERTSTPADPSTVVPCPLCGGRLATPG